MIATNHTERAEAQGPYPITTALRETVVRLVALLREVIPTEEVPRTPQVAEEQWCHVLRPTIEAHPLGALRAIKVLLPEPAAIGLAVQARDLAEVAGP